MLHICSYAQMVTQIILFRMTSNTQPKIRKFNGSKLVKKFVIVDDGLGLFVSPTSWVDVASKSWYYPSEHTWQKKAEKNSPRRSAWPSKPLRIISAYEFGNSNFI